MYRKRNLQFLIQRLVRKLKDVHEPFECAVIADALTPIEAGQPYAELQTVAAEALGLPPPLLHSTYIFSYHARYLREPVILAILCADSLPI